MLSTAELRQASMILAETAGADPVTGVFDAWTEYRPALVRASAVAAVADPARGPKRPTERPAPPVRSSAREAQHLTDVTAQIDTLNDQIRRSEQQGWTTRKLGVSQLRGVRDSLQSLTEQITQLRDQIRTSTSATARQDAEPGTVTAPAERNQPVRPAPEEAFRATTALNQWNVGSDDSAGRDDRDLDERDLAHEVS